MLRGGSGAPHARRGPWGVGGRTGWDVSGCAARVGTSGGGIPEDEPVDGECRVVVVGDQQLLVLGVRHTLEADGLTVLAVAPRADAALAQASPAEPDLVLVLAPLAQGVVDAVRDLRARVARGTRIVALSHDDEVDGDSLLAVMSVGADGWLTLDLPPRVLGRTLRAVHAGEPGISRKHVARLLDVLRRTERRRVTLADGSVAELTPREHEVLPLLLQGVPTREVARRLALSEGTVRWHAASLMKKVGVSSRVDLAAAVRLA